MFKTVMIPLVSGFSYRKLILDTLSGLHNVVFLIFIMQLYKEQSLIYKAENWVTRAPARQGTSFWGLALIFLGSITFLSFPLHFEISFMQFLVNFQGQFERWKRVFTVYLSVSVTERPHDSPLRKPQGRWCEWGIAELFANFWLISANVINIIVPLGATVLTKTGLT